MENSIFGNSSRRRPALAAKKLITPRSSVIRPWSRQKVDADLILNWWRDKLPKQVKFNHRPDVCVNRWTLSNVPQGIGDTVVLTHLNRVAEAHGDRASIYMPNQAFPVLMSHNPHPNAPTRPYCVFAADVQRDHDLGNGHFIQRLQRMFGYRPEPRPQGCLEVVDPLRRTGKRVALHFEAGHHARWQAQHLHPRAREVYPENMDILAQFIKDHPELTFFEIGNAKSKLDTMNMTGQSLAATLRLLSSCDYFIGIISGPMHMATALGLKVITIINFPEPERIYLPTLVNIDQVESEWFYPQNVHLHQDGAGPLVPQFSLETLERAFNGEVYPYWSEDYLDLIYEKL